eukprot:Em0019g319a
MECSEEDIYTIAEYDFDWRRVGRRLLRDQKVIDINLEGSSEAEKREMMLLAWKRTESHDATYQALVKVLRAIQNNATADRIEELGRKNGASPPGVMKYAEYLRSVYKVKPCGEQWLPVVSKVYINLSTVESIEDFPEEKEVTCTLAMIHANTGEVKKMKRSISINEVGVLGDGERARCIVVVGIPGIGKSTFSWHLGVRWAKKEILKDYDLVVLLRLRDERVQHAKCVSDLFYHYSSTPEAVVQWITSCDGNGVMMILDGYDELSPDLQTSSIYADIIKGEVLPKMTVLVSSRPSAKQNLHQLCQGQKCQYIEVIGFGKEEIQEYVDATLEHNKELRDQLNSYLETHPHIHGLMYCPLNCAIIAKIFRDKMKRTRQPPQTLTEVYQLLIETVLKHHEQKSVKSPVAAEKHKKTHTDPNQPSRFPWLGDVSEQAISQLLVLAKLAYDGTNEDQLIFHKPSGTLETLGLLHEVPELYLESSGSSSYHFLHKTVQEFMAALHVSSLPPGERAECVRTSFDESNMTMVVRFMAGLTKLQSQDDIEGVLAFQKEGGRSLLESLHWLFEAHEPGLVQKCMGDREWTLELMRTTLNSFDCYVFGYCIANSRQPWKLMLRECSINEECVKMLMTVEDGRAFYYIQAIDLNGNTELRDQGAAVLGKPYCT